MAYQREPLKAPRLAGLRLRLVAALADSWFFGGLITAMMRRQLGLHALRKIEADGVPCIAAGPVPLEPAEQRPVLPLNELELPPTAEGHLFESSAGIASGYRDGTLTPTQIARRVLAVCRQADQGERPLRAFIAQDEFDLLAQAEASAERFTQGRPLGPLDGIPVAIKDELDQLGYPTTVGTRFLGQTPATADATVVARLRAAGALLIGKANMHEIGIGVTGLNPHHGAARNPYQPEHVPGGSSSGSAVAVAAGLVPLSIGADGGGSVRLPASFCGVLGLKPTFGRVSEQGAAPLCWSVAHIGPLAGSVRDLALGYMAIAGVDPLDAHTWHQPTPHLDGLDSEDLSGLKLGIYRPWFADAEVEIVTVCDQAVSWLIASGAELVEIEIPELELVRPVHMGIIATEMAAAHQAYRKAHRTDYGLDVRINLAIARSVSTIDYLHAQRLRRRLCDHFQQALTAVDLIVTPSAACTAPPLRPSAVRSGESDLPQLERVMRFAAAANLTGLPAISIPVGQDSWGLPIGLQLMGQHWQEHRLLQCARVLESRVPRTAPRVHFSLLED